LDNDFGEFVFKTITVLFLYRQQNRHLNGRIAGDAAAAADADDKVDAVDDTAERKPDICTVRMFICGICNS